MLLELGHFQENFNFLIDEKREPIINGYLKLLILITDVIYKSKLVASSCIKIRSHYWQYYIRVEICLSGLTNFHQSMLGAAGYQSEKANIRVYWGHLEINRPACPLCPVTPLVGRNPVRGMKIRIRAAPTTHMPAKQAVRTDLSLGSLSHVVAHWLVAHWLFDCSNP